MSAAHASPSALARPALALRLVHVSTEVRT